MASLFTALPTRTVSNRFLRRIRGFTPAAAPPPFGLAPTWPTAPVEGRLPSGFVPPPAAPRAGIPVSVRACVRAREWVVWMLMAQLGAAVLHGVLGRAAAGAVVGACAALQLPTAAAAIPAADAAAVTAAAHAAPPPPRVLPSSPPPRPSPPQIARTAVGKQLPVYTEWRHGRSKVYTLIKKVDGDVYALARELAAALNGAAVVTPDADRRMVVVDGDFSREVRRWLHGIGC